MPDDYKITFSSVNTEHRSLHIVIHISINEARSLSQIIQPSVTSSLSGIEVIPECAINIILPYYTFGGVLSRSKQIPVLRK